MLFIFSNSTYFYKNKLNIPIQFIFEEIKAHINSKYIEVVSAIDHLVISNVKQLLIFINAYRIPQAVLLNEILRCIQLLLTYNIVYDKYSFWIGGDKYYSGTTTFKTDALLQDENLSIDKLVNSCEHYLLFFIPGKEYIQKFIKYTYYLTEFFKAYKNSLKQLRNKNSYNIIIRYNKLIKKQHKCSVETKIILLTNEIKIDIIQNNYKKIIKKVMKEVRNKTKIKDGKLRFLGYIRISVYDSNKRIRNLSGLEQNLICTIDYLNLKKFRVINIQNGIVQKHGKYQIVWNSNYLNSLQNN